MLERDLLRVKTKVIKPEIIHPKEFSENPEERLATVLAGFANRETKGVTLLLLGESPKTPNDLWQEFLEVTDNCWKIDHRLLSNYCDETLIPIWVTKEAAGYTVTEVGKHYGQPIAAFLLQKVVEEYGHSFYPIFGPTHAPPNSPPTSRAPFKRARILEIIVQAPGPLRTIDIANSLGLPRRAVSGHLDALDEASLIRYTPVNTEKSGFACYQWQPETKLEEVESVKDHPWLTLQVAQILARGEKAMNREDVQNALQKLFPGRIFGRRIISSILSGLAKQGLANAQFQGRKKQSEIKLLDKGEQFYQEILLSIKEALDDGPVLKEIRALLPVWRSFAPEAVSFYREVYSRRESPSVWQERVLGLLNSYPDGLRPKEVAEALDNLSQTRASFHLGCLYEQGLVNRETEGRGVRYSLNQKPKKT